MRLALMGFWLAVAVGLFFGPFRPADGTSTAPAGLLALALAGWNYVRWRAARSVGMAPTTALELHRQTRHVPKAEYHPEFDFSERDQKPRRD